MVFYFLFSNLSNETKLYSVVHTNVESATSYMQTTAEAWANSYNASSPTKALTCDDKDPVQSGYYVKYVKGGKSMTAFNIIVNKENNWIYSNGTIVKINPLGTFFILESSDANIITLDEHKLELENIRVQGQNASERLEFRLEKEYNQIIENYKTTVDNQKDYIDTLESSMKILKDEVIGLKVDLDTEADKYSCLVDESDLALSRVRTDLMHSEERNTRTINIMRNLEDLVKVLREQLADSRDHQYNTRLSADKLEDEISMLKEEAREYKNDSYVYKKQIDNLRSERDEMEREVVDLRTKLASCFCQRQPTVTSTVKTGSIKKDLDHYQGVIDELKSRFSKPKPTTSPPGVPHFIPLPPPPPSLPPPIAASPIGHSWKPANVSVNIPPLPPVDKKKTFNPYKLANDFISLIGNDDNDTDDDDDDVEMQSIVRSQGNTEDVVDSDDEYTIPILPKPTIQPTQSKTSLINNVLSQTMRELDEFMSQI